jgi:threonine-phosphate decarboxylase
MIYGHGDDIYQYGNQVKMNFSSNIFTHADLSQLKMHLAMRLDVIGSYPEPEPITLERLLAEKLGIQPQQVMVTAGATEAIYLIAQLFKGWASVIPQPTFGEYEDACKQHDHVVSYFDNDTMEQLPEKRIYWLCNPNNPTGNVMVKGLMSYVVRHHPHFIYVVDQSYENYTRKALLLPREMTDCHNLLILHSMTKRYCVPGLRLGYITGSPVILDRLRALRQPWSVNAMALEAGKYALENDFEPIADREAYLDEAARLQTSLAAIEGITVMDSHTNFMLCRLDNGEARQLKQWLLENHGMLIRDASNFHGLDSRYFRVAAQSRDEDNALIEAIQEFLSGKSRHFTKYW